MKLFTTIPRIEGERLVLKRLTQDDAGPLERLAHSRAVYRYLPTFKKVDVPQEVVAETTDKGDIEVVSDL